MGLTSFTFFAFICLFLLVYFIIPKRTQWFFLLIASFVFLFYGNLNANTIICVLSTIISSYIGAIYIEKNKGKKKSLYICIVSVLLILAPLIFLKYINFIGVTLMHLSHIFGKNFTWITISGEIPLGISYYTLIMIGYVIDVYRETCNAQKNILKCSLFMCYFPQMTSGPITRYSIKDDLFSPHKFDYTFFTNGLVRILWGLFKILVLSSRLGIFVDGVYANINEFNGLYVLFATLFYTLQLYTNFSGSIDIIMGISEILGIKLPENFKQPFFSKSITELWRRWHISLGLWLKDFVFYPLLKSNFIQKMTKKSKLIFGKKWGKRLPLYLSMLVLWTVIGVWHGGSYSYIIASGWLQFFYIIVEDITEPWVKKMTNRFNIDRDKFGYKLFRCTKTFLLFSFSLIFFRAKSVSHAFAIIKSLFSLWNPWILFDHVSLYKVGLDRYDFFIMIISLVILFSIDYMDRVKSVRKRLTSQNIVFRWIILYVLIFSVIIFGNYGVGYDKALFIYGQF